MTNRQIALIQESWDLVKPSSKNLGLIFYNKLFTHAPELQHLFPDDLTLQSAKLIAMLNFIVSKLSRFEDILYDIHSLGSGHHGYGTLDIHYDLVGSCLIETLAEQLAGNWNEELNASWTTAYDHIKLAMIEAQEHAAQRAKD